MNMIRVYGRFCHSPVDFRADSRVYSRLLPLTPAYSRLLPLTPAHADTQMSTEE